MRRHPDGAPRARVLAAVLASCAGLACSGEPAPSGPSVTALGAGGDVSFASFSQFCAVMEGTLQCWGANRFGQLGDRTPAARAPLPVAVPGLPGPVEAVALGGAHTCALIGAEASCWGSNTGRQLGSDRASMRVAPESVAGLPVPVTALAAGRQHSCAIAAGGVWCWGVNSSGQLGRVSEQRCSGLYGSLSCSGFAGRVEGLGGEASAIALGDAHSCALVAGNVRCWGRADRGRLGAPGRGPAPVGQVSLPGPAVALSAGATHSCAIVDGGVWCWGANDRGQLGDGSREDRVAPVAVSGLPQGVDAIALGRLHSCAIAAGRAWCWGSDEEGQVGGQGDADTARRVPGLPGRVTSLAAGADATCAVVDAVRIFCWGDNDSGQLGSGDAPRDHAGPVVVGDWDTGRIRDVSGDGRIRLSCLGDSNTHASPGRPKSWCDRLPGLMAGSTRPWVTVNRAIGGASATGGSLRPASQQVTYTLENDAPDVVVLAFGTNDLLVDASPEQVLVALMQHRQRARSAGADVFVALTPPAWPETRPVNAAIGELNELLRATLPESRVIDFHAGFGAADFSDGIHLNDAGQERRARAAAEVLRAAGVAESP